MSLEEITVSKQLKYIQEQYGESILQFKHKLLEKFRLIERLNTPIWYPEELKIVPLYKFTKIPIVKWSHLQNKPYNDPEVVKLKISAGKLGKLINTAMVLDGILVIDLDSDRGKDSVQQLSRYFDWETRRGFHKIFVLKDAKTALFRFGQAKALGKTQIHIPELNARLEIKSGANFLSTYPYQSHYLIIDSKKQDILIRRYEPLSLCAKKIVFANDLTCAIASPDEIKEHIYRIIETVNPALAKSVKNNFTIEPKKDSDISTDEINVSVPRNESKSLNLYGTLSYEEFKQFLESRFYKLPNCIKIAFFDSVEEGYGFAFALLAAKVFPFFVRGTEEEVAKVAKDFASRFRSFKGAKLYYWYYYGFGSKPSKEKVGTPTAIDIPDEIYEMLYSKSSCEMCLYKQICRVYNTIRNGKKEGYTPRYILLQLAKEQDV